MQTDLPTGNPIPVLLRIPDLDAPPPIHTTEPLVEEPVAPVVANVASEPQEDAAESPAPARQPLKLEPILQSVARRRLSPSWTLAAIALLASFLVWTLIRSSGQPDAVDSSDPAPPAMHLAQEQVAGAPAATPDEPATNPTPENKPSPASLATAEPATTSKPTHQANSSPYSTWPRTGKTKSIPVAQFEGIITKPNFRARDERNRSSIY